MKKLAQALQFISIALKGRLSLLTAIQKKEKKNTKTFRTKKNPYGEVLEDVLKSKKSGKSIKQQLDDMLNEATTSERINVTNRNVSIIKDGKIIKRTFYIKEFDGDTVWAWGVCSAIALALCMIVIFVG